MNVILMGVCEGSAASVAGDVGNTLALVVVVCRLGAEHDTTRGARILYVIREAGMGIVVIGCSESLMTACAGDIGNGLAAVVIECRQGGEYDTAVAAGEVLGCTDADVIVILLVVAAAGGALNVLLLTIAGMVVIFVSGGKCLLAVAAGDIGGTLAVVVIESGAGFKLQCADAALEGIVNGSCCGLVGSGRIVRLGGVGIGGSGAVGHALVCQELITSHVPVSAVIADDAAADALVVEESIAYGEELAADRALLGVAGSLCICGGCTDVGLCAGCICKDFITGGAGESFSLSREESQLRTGRIEDTVGNFSHIDDRGHAVQLQGSSLECNGICFLNGSFIEDDGAAQIKGFQSSILGDPEDIDVIAFNIMTHFYVHIMNMGSNVILLVVKLGKEKQSVFSYRSSGSCGDGFCCNGLCCNSCFCCGLSDSFRRSGGFCTATCQQKQRKKNG